MVQPLLRVVGIRKKFPGVKAVDFDPSDEIAIGAGEVRALVGENGAGKSTLIHVISGIYAKDAGGMWLEGEPYIPTSVVDAQAKGVGIVLQEPALLPTLTIADNILLGQEDSYSRWGIMSLGARDRMCQEVLNQFGLRYMRPDTVTSLLDFESRRLVELVKAVYRDPSVLIIDEAAAALSVKGIEFLFSIIRQFKKKGAAVIYVTHRLEEVFHLCDTLTVMKDGKLVKTVPVAETDINEVCTLMVGRELSIGYFRQDSEGSMSDDVVLRVENLTARGIFEGVSFEVHKGEILGIGGLVGGGVQELARALFGDFRVHSGTIWYEGELLHPSPANALRHGISYIPKERDKEGLILCASIRHNISLPILNRLVKRGFLNIREEKVIASRYMEELNIVAPSPESFCINLSGGNRQKVVLAKWLGTHARVFIMNNPTRGVDVATKADIHRLMMGLKEEGVAVILFSEELPELIGMSDRILVMREAMIHKEFHRADHPTEEQLIQHMV